MKSAFVLGGTGVLGEPTARRLSDDGWDVTVATRGSRPLPASLRKRGIKAHTFNRADSEALFGSVGDGVDLFVDVIPFDRSDAEQLVALRGRIGALVVVSSAAVYADEAGRPLLTYRDERAPSRPTPISETQPTVTPDDSSYRGRKSAVERALLEHEPAPVTILRPPAVYGVGDTLAREWYFVKRVLDRRPHVVLALRGQTTLHVASAENVAELVRLAAARPETRVLNAADLHAPSAVEIGRTIASVLGHSWQEVQVNGPPGASLVGDNPWCVRKPFMLDMAAARRDLGYLDDLSFTEGMERTCRWLLAAVRGRDWREALPKTAIWCGRSFDYEAEDVLVDWLREGRRPALPLTATA